MAEVFAPFIINRTIRNLTFYCMEGRNFVRKKSSLTRRKVLHSPRFERTRHYASLMGEASKIGSFLYHALPAHWRQSWMYRSFTGEAFTMLKKGKEEWEIKQFLWDRYVQEVAGKQKEAKPLTVEPTTTKRPYKKQDTTYWETKTRKSIRRKVLIQQRQRNAGLLAEASKIASELYWELPARNRNRSIYQQLTGWAMRLLKELQDDEVMAAKQPGIMRDIGYLNTPKGMFYFIPLLQERLSPNQQDLSITPNQYKLTFVPV